jgi:hypothetical protein
LSFCILFQGSIFGHLCMLKNILYKIVVCIVLGSHCSIAKEYQSKVYLFRMYMLVQLLWFHFNANFCWLIEWGGEKRWEYVVCSKSYGTFEIVRQLGVLAMSGKLCCLMACFLIIILFAASSCYD